MTTSISPINSYLSASGTIRYTFTNDFMFKISFQNKKFLSALLCALLHLEPDQIKEITINNPISSGDVMEQKTMILDLDIIMNNDTLINLEMQVLNHKNWSDRSLFYLCRSFDQLFKGESYESCKHVLHISILDFTFFPEYPEFYATYMLSNIKNHHIYNDKFKLNVLDLKQIHRATNEDKSYGLDKWAALFKATTWEEIKMMAANNETFDQLAQVLYKSNADDKIRYACQQREDYEREERRTQRAIAKDKELIAKQATMLSQNADEIAALKAQIAALKAGKV